MTFQIGIVTDDGVMLASDRKNTSIHGYRTSQMVSKIRVSDNGNLGYCSAGDTSFCAILETVVDEEMSTGRMKFTGEQTSVYRAILECLRIAQGQDETFRRERGLPKTTGGSTIFVFREGEDITLWTVNTTEQVPSISLSLPGEYVKAGDANTPAVFFPHRYFDKVQHTAKALIPLAVHTVLMAEGEYVKGVQVGLFTRNEFKILSDDELKPYIELSKEIDSEILKRLRDTRQKDSI